MQPGAKLCPTEPQLAAFVAGKLDHAESTEVEEHLAECASCCQTLKLLPDDDTLVALLRQAEVGTNDGSRHAERGPDATALVEPASRPATSLPGDDVTEHADTAAGAYSVFALLPQPLRDHARYRITELLGRGGMGDVYKAEHRLMNRPVALKVINGQLVNSTAAIQRFQREVQAAARLTHRNIVTAYDAEQAGDTHFLVMEFVDGTDLAALVRLQGPLPVTQACAYIRQAASGLHHAHEAGMVHRDIKPQNLIVAHESRASEGARLHEPPESGTVKILDFGLARFASEAAAPEAATLDELPAATPHLTALGTMMGTPDFMAPEQARDAHTADIRSDIYSLGCTLYYLLAGEPPFLEKSVRGKVQAHLEREPVSLRQRRSDVPPELEAVLRRMMAKNPAARYAAPAEVAAALAPFAELTPQVAPRGRRPRRRWTWAAFGLVPLALLAGVIIYLATDTGQVEIDTSGLNLAGAKVVLLKNQQPYATFQLTSTEQPQVIRAGDYQIELQDVPKDVRVDFRSRTRNGQWDVPRISHDNAIVLYRGGGIRIEVSRIPRPHAPPYVDREHLQGTWIAESGVRNGRPTLSDQLSIQRAVFIGERVEVEGPGGVRSEGQFQLFDSRPPKQMTIITGRGNVLRGIYQLEQDRFTLCYNLDRQGNVPTEFAAPAGSNWDLLVLRRFPASAASRDAAGSQPAPASRDIAPLGLYSKHEGFVYDALITPDGKLAISCGQDQTIQVWDLATREPQHVLRGHAGALFSLAVSADGTMLASGDNSNSLRLWDLSTGQQVGSLEGHTGAVTNLAFMPDGIHLLSAGFDETLRLWHVAERKLVRTIPVGAKIEKLVPLPDGQRVMLSGAHTGGWGIVTYDLEPGNPIDTKPSAQSCLAVSADGSKTLIGSVTGLLVVRDSEKGRLLVQMADPRAKAARDAAISQDGKWAVTSTRERQMHLWNLQEGKLVSSIEHPSIGTVVLSPDGRTVLTYADDSGIGIWKLPDLAP